MVDHRQIAERTDLPGATERRLLRVTAGIQAHVLAARVGVSPSSIHAWESHRDPTGLQLRAYREALVELATSVGEEAGVSWPRGF